MLANPYKMGIKNESTVKCSLQGVLVEYHFLHFAVKSRQGNLPCDLIVIYFLYKVNSIF